LIDRLIERHLITFVFDLINTQLPVFTVLLIAVQIWQLLLQLRSLIIPLTYNSHIQLFIAASTQS